MSKRFYVPQPITSGDSIEVDAALAHRLAKVLRLRAGAEIVLFDGSGAEARVRIETLHGRGGTTSVVERFDGMAEPRVRVHLYQSITKGERFEWLVEKGAEIGVARFVPLITARSVVKTGADAAKAERWRRIAVEAAEQCGRSAVPRVDAPLAFDDALASAEGVLLLPYESAGHTASTIQRALDAEIDALYALGAVSIFIGPEGGFEEAEVARARAAGAVIVTMGARVLRSETAGLVASMLVMHASGELG